MPYVNHPTGFNPSAVTLGDLNGDGKPDLAVANTGGYHARDFCFIIGIQAMFAP